MRIILSLLVVGCLRLSLAADSLFTYQWHNAIDIPIITLSGGLGFSSIFLQKKLSPLSLEEVQQLNSWDINSLDRYAIRQNSLAADKASDALQYISMATPALLFSGAESRNNWKIIVPMWVETFAFNTALNLSVKALTGRIRPYVYRQNDRSYSAHAKSSFYSGHTSAAASSSFFTAMVFSGLYPHSRWKPLIWTGAALLPAFTAICRVEAGQHYWTDVLTGYAIGAGVGTLIPFLHQKLICKRKNTYHSL